MKKILIILLVIGFSFTQAYADEDPENYIDGMANIYNLELEAGDGCMVQFDFWYEGLLFVLDGWAPKFLCDGLWTAALVHEDVYVTLAYKFNPLRIRFKRLALDEF